jgi:diadenosine tetraphosphatase ApaH/serine/threonine PP2A family protein phosphatase
MRYAIVSDLHANLQAWNAVFLDLRSNGAERILCLGDLVGYGPHPAETLQAAHQHVDHFVLGNHDAALCGKLDEALFNDTARDLIRWTRSRLGHNAIRFLATLPLTLAGEGFRCAHGDFDNPAAFPYLLSPQDALASWRRVEEPLLFVGHTHEPALYLLGGSGTPHAVAPQDFELEAGKRYLVNVGSVGSPRDGDARASYCLYDTEQRAVYWRRVPFDLDAFREAVKAAGIPDAPSCFLHHDPRQGRRPIRDLLSFSPPTSPGQAVRDVVEVQSIIHLRRHVRAWQTGFALLLVLTLLAAVAGGVALWRHRTRALVLTAPGFQPVDASRAGPEQNLLPLPDRPTTAGQSIPGWQVRLGNRHRQRAHMVRLEDGTPAVEMTSAQAEDPMDLVSPRIAVKPGMSFRPAALFRKSTPFTGSIALVVSLTRQVGGREERVEQFYVKEPNQAKADGWQQAREKFDIPAGGTAIQLHLRGRFTGTVLVKDLILTHRKTAAQ